MDDDRWQRIQTLFAAALEQRTEERAAYLQQECGDDEALRREVESLLRSVSQAGTFVDGAVREGLQLFDEASTPRRLGKYEVLEKVGQGGFGAVYRARDPELDRQVAIKTCLHESPEMRRRFLREGRLAAALRHPYIVAVFELSGDGETPFMVQEFLDGRDLDRIAPTLSLPDKIDILAKVAAGLDHAHEHGVIHRDIKPSNVRVLPGGGVKLLDFGIARTLDSQTRLTATGSALGTVGYLAPEQLSGGDLDPRADLFAFGVLAYELLAGKRPFRGDSFSHVSYQLLYVDPEPLTEAWPRCPDQRLAQIVERCLNKKREDRPESMQEVFQALDAVRRDLATHEHVETLAFTPPEIRKPGGRPRIAGMMIVVVVLMLGATVFWLGGNSPPESSPPEEQLAEVVEPSPPVSVPESDSDPLGAESEIESEPAAALPAQTSKKTDPPQGIETRESASEETQPSEPGIVETPSVSSRTQESVEEPKPKEPDAAEAESSSNEARPLEAPARSASIRPTPKPEPVPVPTAPPVVEAAPEDIEADQTDAPAPADDLAEPMRLGDHIAGPGPGITEPQPIAAVEPDFPRPARRARRTAEVTVAVYVDETGSVVRALLARPDDSKLGFNKAALDAARATRFRPALKDGVAGKMWTEIVYTFRP